MIDESYRGRGMILFVYAKTKARSLTHLTNPYENIVIKKFDLQMFTLHIAYYILQKTYDFFESAVSKKHKQSPFPAESNFNSSAPFIAWKCNFPPVATIF